MVSYFLEMAEHGYPLTRKECELEMFEFATTYKSQYLQARDQRGSDTGLGGFCEERPLYFKVTDEYHAWKLAR